VENRKKVKKTKKTDRLRSVGIQPGLRGIRGVSAEEEKERYGGKDLQKKKVLSMDWCFFLNVITIAGCKKNMKLD